jgi:hypothetical protein
MLKQRRAAQREQLLRLPRANALPDATPEDDRHDPHAPQVTPGPS